jgi:hypothetical protein
MAGRALRPERFIELLDAITYKEGWRFDVYATNGQLYLQAVFPAPCAISGREQIQKGRKWLLSPHMTTSEFVATVFKACLTAEEHEARECFTYRAYRVYGPHLDVEDLVTALRSGDVETEVRS